MKFVLLVVWCAYFILLPEVKGFFSNCNRNETLFIPEGSSATFSAEQPDPYPNQQFYKYNETSHRVFYSRVYSREISDLRFRDPWIKNRTRVTGEGTNITITIRDVEKADNGTYVLYLRDRNCFVLFVVGIHKQLDESIEEHSPAYFYAYPKASAIHRPIINATMVWLVDGKNTSQSPLFVIQDGMIWLASVSRALNGRNVTYRAVQDNGMATEINYTIEVTYGPEAPLEFTPDTEHYFLTNGHVMPEVSCSVNCSPPCNVSWDTHGKGNKLSLGKVSTSMTGAYTCTATRPGTDIAVKRRLVVQVEDTSALTSALTSTLTVTIAVLSSIQAATTIILVLCGVFIHRRNNAKPCKSDSKSSNLRNNGDRETIFSHKNEGNDINETALEHYEELVSESRIEQHLEQYEKVQSQVKTAEDMYANTKIA